MGPAPLRETMAAQLIMLSRWDARTEPLVDPMAGGGTIPIEAAAIGHRECHRGRVEVDIDDLVRAEVVAADRHRCPRRT